MTESERHIEEHLAYSNRLRCMAVGHQQEVMQLLENIEQLQDDLRATTNELNDARQANIAKDAIIRQLQAELDAMRNRSTQFFSRITTGAYDKGIAQTVEDELRSAAKASASKLVAAIRTNELLGYIDTKNLSSVDLYDLLNSHFGLNYSKRNFTIARSRK